MKRISNQFSSIEQVTDQFFSNGVRKQGTSAEVSFEQILLQKSGLQEADNTELKFSKHASNRLMDRNISLTQNQNERLENGVKAASEKGIKESLVLVDSLAFIVNVPNRTVVTAMEQTETTSNIFTNIDGAVIM